jgi:hypothetical protein
MQITDRKPSKTQQDSCQTSSIQFDCTEFYCVSVSLSVNFTFSCTRNITRGFLIRFRSSNSNKSANQMQQILQFITSRLFTAQHVSGVLTSIIRSSTTAAATGFTFGVWW